MTTKTSKIKQYALYSLLAIIHSSMLWVAISSRIQAFKCPSLTETQLFLRIPRSFVCDWQYCD